MAGSPRGGLRRVRPAVAAAIAVAVVLAAAIGTGSAGAGRGGLELKRVGSFEAPVFVDDAPGKRRLLFVVEQRGTIAVVREGEIGTAAAGGKQ